MALSINTDMELAARTKVGEALNAHVQQVTDSIAVINAAITTLTTQRNTYESAGDTANANAIDAKFALLKTALGAMAGKIPAALR